MHFNAVATWRRPRKKGRPRFRVVHGPLLLSTADVLPPCLPPHLTGDSAHVSSSSDAAGGERPSKMVVWGGARSTKCGSRGGEERRITAGHYDRGEREQDRRIG